MRVLFKILIGVLLLALLVFFSGDFYLKEFFRGYSLPATQTLIIAHRGASGNAPENTLAAIDLALRQKADMIEIDIFLSKDNQLVVMHDQRVDRTTNGQGNVEELTLAELKKLDAGSWFSDKFTGEKIPTLAEVLHKIQGKTRLLIEIKQSGRGIAQKTDALIRQYKAESWCVIQSFDHQVIQNLDKTGSSLEKHQLVIGNLPLFLPYHYNKKLSSGNIYQYKQVASVNPMYLFTTLGVIRKLHAQGKKVTVWTVNHPNDIKKLIQMGVDGIITNYPAKAKKIRERILAND